jgi:sec-independent protein translocase protein TatC
MPLEGHLDELRRRLMLSVVVVLPLFVVGYLIHTQVVQLIEATAHPYVTKLYQLSPQEVFFTYMRVDFILSLIAASPIWLYQTLAFFLPAFGRQARNMILRLLPTMILLFLAGATFGLKILLPIVLRFFVGFTGDAVISVITLGNYTSFLLGIVLPPGFLFELPLIAYGLASAGIVTAVMLRRGRRFALMGAALLSAIFAPPGPIPMLAIGVPVYALFEASIVVSAVTERAIRRRRARAESEDDAQTGG